MHYIVTAHTYVDLYLYHLHFIQAYRLGFHYPKYMFITYGWYANNWWTIPATSSRYNCTAEERATVLPYTLAPTVPEFPTDLNAQAEPGIVSLLKFIA